MTYLEPPEGWYPFGTHVDTPSRMEFSQEVDDAGMPIWERPFPTTTSPLRDEDLPHQIVLLFDKATHGAPVRVTCNCLAWLHPNQARTHRFMPGIPKDTPEALEIYNNPNNHRPNKGQEFKASR